MPQKEDKRLTITGEHLKLLQRMYVGWQEGDYGAPEINPKRPYGDSDVEMDIIEILGWSPGDEGPSDEQLAAAEKMHRQMADVLQICLTNLVFRTGVYVQTDPYNDPGGWKRVESITPI